MKPLLQRASRSIFANAVFGVPSPLSRSFSKSFLESASNAPSICLRCQFRTVATFPNRHIPSLNSNKLNFRAMRRQLSSSKSVFDEKKPPERLESSPIITPPPPQDHASPSFQPAKAAAPPKVEDTIARVPAEDLPSHREGQRWNLSKRLSEFMDDILPKLAIVTQKVNTYTGTDYSGIEALRKEIKDQEKLVKARRLAIDEAKQGLDAAHAQQASSQKEVVALLERKHSWSAHDLERYMSLIRSEHVNDQAVREAKEAVHAAESALEEARSHLEKRERAQYHEEQIWSDTIRRNSTWVTFGLMGLNIFLLLASLVAIEPWRRSRMVKEIKRALDAQVTAMGPASIAPTIAAQPSAMEAKIDAVIEPAGKSLEELEAVRPTSSPPSASAAVENVEHPVGVQDVRPIPTAGTASPRAAPLTPEQFDAQETIDIEEEVRTSTPPRSWGEKITFAARDLVSDRSISIRKVDYTTALLQATTAGAVVSCALIALLRPR